MRGPIEQLRVSSMCLVQRHGLDSCVKSDSRPKANLDWMAVSLIFSMISSSRGSRSCLW